MALVRLVNRIIMAQIVQENKIGHPTMRSVLKDDDDDDHDDVSFTNMVRMTHITY